MNARIGQLPAVAAAAGIALGILPAGLRAQPGGRVPSSRLDAAAVVPNGTPAAAYEPAGKLGTLPDTALPFSGLNVQKMVLKAAPKAAPGPDAASADRVLASGLTDPLAVARGAESLVLERLKERGYRDLALRDPEATDLNPAPPPPKGARSAAAARPSRRGPRLWSVSWQLDYLAGPKPTPIPLPASCRVNALIRGGDVEVDLSGLPRPEELPAPHRLRRNVAAEQAAQVVRDDFLARNGGPGKLQPQDVDIQKRLELWQPRLQPEAPGRPPQRYVPAWALTATVRGRPEAPEPVLHYRVEAVAADPARPQILDRWSERLRAVGLASQPGPDEPVLFEPLNQPNIEPEEAAGIAVDDFLEEAQRKGYRLQRSDLVVLGPVLGPAPVPPQAGGADSPIVWWLVLGVRLTGGDGPPSRLCAVDAHVVIGNPRVRRRVEVSAALRRNSGRVFGRIWLENQAQDQPARWELRPLHRVALRFYMGHPASETNQAGEYLCFSAGDMRVPFALAGTVCRIDGDGGLDAPCFAALLAGPPCATDIRREAIRLILKAGALAALGASGASYQASLAALVAGPPCATDIHLDATRLSLGAQAVRATAMVNAFYWANHGFDYYAWASGLGSRLKPPAPPLRLKVNDPAREEFEPAPRRSQPATIYIAADMQKVSPLYRPMSGACGDLVLHEFAHAMTWQAMPLARQGAAQAAYLEQAAYAEGFADAFSILARRQRVVGADVLAAGGHVRDYRFRETRVNRDGQPQRVLLTYQAANDQPLQAAFAAQFGDDAIHLNGRVYAHFICDLIDGIFRDWSRGLDLAPPPPLACALPGRLALRMALWDQVHDRVARLAVTADRAQRRSIPEAVYIMYAAVSTRDDEEDDESASPYSELLMTEILEAALGRNVAQTILRRVPRDELPPAFRSSWKGPHDAADPTRQAAGGPEPAGNSEHPS